MQHENKLSTQEPKTVRGLIESDKFKLAVESILPKHLTPSRFVRIAIASLTRTPKLADCDPNTVLQCLMQLSQFGLEPDGRNAYLIPFGNVCTLIISYMGLVALAKRSGHVSNIHADTVCENDQFHFDKGVVVKHEIDFKKDRGKPYAYYAMVRYKDGTEQSVCMTKAEVDRIKARSRASSNGPWVTDYDEMAKKTVFRRLSKWLELSPEFRDAVEADADAVEDLRFENAIPIQRPKIARIKDKDLSGGVGTDTNEAQVHEPSTRRRNDAGESSVPPAQTDSPVGAPTTPPEPPKKKLRIRETPSSEQTAPAAPSVGPLEGQMLERLAKLNRTKEQLVEVAKMFDSLKPEQGWVDIGEEGFGVLLHADNFKLVQAELEKMG